MTLTRQGLSISKLFDGTIALHTRMQGSKDKGDFVLSIGHSIEFAMALGQAANKLDAIAMTDTISHGRRKIRPGTVELRIGYAPHQLSAII